MKIEQLRTSRTLRGAPILWAGLSIALVSGIVLRVCSVAADSGALGAHRRTSLLLGLMGLALTLFHLGCLLRQSVYPRADRLRLHVFRDAQVASGVLASALIALHASSQPQSLLGLLGAIILTCTLLTGVLGRILLALMPGPVLGLRRRIAELESLVPGVEEPLEQALSKPPARPLRSSGPWQVLRALPSVCRSARARRVWVLAVYRCRAAHADARERAHARPVAQAVAELAALDVYAVATGALVRAWPSWHRRCALLIVAGMLLHAGATLLYG